MAERHVYGGSERGDFCIRSDERRAAADSVAHGFAELWVNDGAAVLQITIHADNCGLAVADGGTGQLRHHVLHQAFTERAADIEQGGQVFLETTGERILKTAIATTRVIGEQALPTLSASITSLRNRVFRTFMM